MDSIGQSRRSESVDESSALRVGEVSGIVIGGDGLGSGEGAGAKHAAAAELRALANQARGVGDLKKVSAMQAAAGVEECFGAARADALREQIRRSKAASSSSSRGTGPAHKAVDACEGAGPGGMASDTVLGGGDATASGRASPASAVCAERSDQPAGVDEEAPVAGEPESAVSLACFRTRAACVAPDPGRADCRLLEPVPVDTAEIVYGIPGAQVAAAGWHVPVQRCGGIRNHGHTCFVNATVKVLSRVEGFVRCLPIAGAAVCFVCAEGPDRNAAWGRDCAAVGSGFAGSRRAVGRRLCG